MLNRLTNLVHEKIRGFRFEKFKEVIYEAGESGSIWMGPNIIKGYRNNINATIHGRTGVKDDSLDNAIAVAECLEEQFSPNEPDTNYWSHSNRSGEGCKSLDIIASTLVSSR